MLPFSASLLRVVPHDGSLVLIKNKPSSEDTADEQSGNTSTVTLDGGKTVIHSRHSGSDGLGGTEVPIVAIVFVFLWLIVKALVAPFTQRNLRRSSAQTPGAQTLSEEEQAVLLKLQRTLAQMESRVESLETILIDEHRTKEKYGNKI